MQSVSQETVTSKIDPSRRAAAVAVTGLVLVVVGGSTFNILPLITAGSADKLGFSAAQAGVMASVITFASGISALLAGAWVRSLPWSRVAAAALGGMLVAYLATMLTHGYWPFVLMQGAAAFFSGSAFSLGMTILSDSHESARSFGVAISAQATYQIAALWAGPSLLRLAGLDGVLILLAIPAAMAIPPTLLLRSGRRVVTAERAIRGLFKPATLIAFAGFLLFFVGAGTYWTYFELMGQAQGMTTQTVANWTAAATAAGIPGGLLASAQRGRFGSLKPLAWACVLILVAATLLTGKYGLAALGAAGVIYYFSWCYSLSYQLAFVSAVDATGRAVAITGACAFFGSAAGAALAAPFVTPQNYHAVVWIVATTICVSTAMYAIAGAIHRRSRSTA